MAGTGILLPTFSYSKTLNLNDIQFSKATHDNNHAQTIIIFMSGGASQLAGNISNIEDINKASQSNYSYFRSITQTTNNCWQEAGGTHMEKLIANGDMSLFRCCYSQVREQNNNKAHGVCSSQNQKGSFDEDSAGIIANLAQILEANSIVNENSVMPFITFTGESTFYAEGKKPLNSYLKPVGLDENLNNPYDRYERDWRYYTAQEQKIPDYNNREKGFSAALYAKMDALAQKNNHDGKIKDAFSKRVKLNNFIEDIKKSTTPDLGDDAYPVNNNFSKKLETAIKILVKNQDTKVITIGTGGLGGWDDHNDARNYVTRMESLFTSLNSAMAHIRSESKENSINIMVFSEFGRNVNLNSALGWDHGNLQNLYVLGGKGYFNHKGVVGETTLGDTGRINRLYLKPKEGSYQFEPLSIASTLYKIYGIENPEILTNDNAPISPLF